MRKVTVIGDTSSGKTSFLYAMYNFVAMGYVDGFTMSAADDIADNKLQDKFSILENSSLGEERFPKPSNEREAYEFELQYGFAEIATFEWVDYPGGYISENGEGRNELTNDLKNSDAWVIFIDGEKILEVLLSYDERLQKKSEKKDKISEDEFKSFLQENEDKTKKEMISVCGKYNKFIGKLISQKISIPKALPIIITKGDLIANSGIENWQEKIQNIMKQGLSPCFADNFQSLVSISTVSLGNNIAENNFRGNLDPINIEYPITISMLSILNNLFAKELPEIARLNDLIEEDYNKFFSSRERREDWQRQIDVIAPKLVKWQKMAKAILGTLHDEKSLWYFGEKLSMIDYYKTIFCITEN